MVSCLQGRRNLELKLQGKQKLREAWMGVRPDKVGLRLDLRAAGAKASRINKTENRR